MFYSDRMLTSGQGGNTFPCLVAGFLGVIIVLTSLFGTVHARAGELLVFAAASQRNALDAVIAAYTKASGETVKASYQSSSGLARQIEQGAPADIYISANPEWMTYLQQRKLIDTATRSDMFGTALVLVTAKDNSAGNVDIKPGFDLAGIVGEGRLAVGDPDHVPAGIYAKHAMLKLGVWEKVEAKLARADNVRSALALVARGEAPYGIVYSSDAVADNSVKIVGHFPESSHPPIVYPVAVTAETGNAKGARAFLAFLRKPETAKIYQQFGFRVLGSATN